MNGVDELRDIKPLLEIPDYSYYMTMGLLVLSLLFATILLFFVIKRIFQNRKMNMQKLYFKALKSVDWTDSKQASYRVTYFGRKLSTDTRSKEIFSQLLPMLEVYKYKKDVPRVDTQTLNQYNLLVHVIDESL